MNSVGWCALWVAGCGFGLLTGERANGSAGGVGIEPIYGQGLLLLAFACIVPAAVAWPHLPTRWLSLLVMAFLGGCGSALLVHPPVTPADLAFYNSQPGQPGVARVLVVGEITGEPVLADKSQRIRFSARQIKLSVDSIPYPVKGDLIAVVTRYPEYELGVRLALSGSLTAPPRLSSFDYPAYLARLGVFSYMSFPRVTELGSPEDTGILGALAQARPRIRDVLQRALPEPQAALTVGVVTGDHTRIPDDVTRHFRRSGITHIIAISGQNIAILVGVVLLPFGAKSRRRITFAVFLLSAVVITLYTLFTGASPSVVRAAIMAIVLLPAPLVHRRYDPIAALAATATVMVMLDPDVLADAGFQLSFAAMLGIALFTDPLFALTSRLRIPGVLGVPIAVSIAAQGATLPLSALIFGLISLVALPATLIAEVALLPLMITGIAAGLAGAIFAPLAIPFGVLTWPFATWILWWVQLWAGLPFAAVDVTQFNPAWVIAYYGALGMAVWLVHRGKRAGLTRADFALATLGVTGVALWTTLITLMLSR